MSSPQTSPLRQELCDEIKLIRQILFQQRGECNEEAPTEALAGTLLSLKRQEEDFWSRFHIGHSSAIAVVDPQLRLIRHNKRFETLIGIPGTRLKHRPALETLFNPQAQLRSLTDRISSTVHSPKRVRSRSELISVAIPNRQTLLLSLFILPIVDRYGDHLHTLVIMRDRRQARHTLQKRETSALQKAV